VPNLKDVALNLRIKDDTGVLTLVGPIGISYRTDKISPPKTWKDLWTVPEYKGKIGIYNIVNSAGQMFVCLTSKLFTGGDKDIDTAYKKIAELKPWADGLLRRQEAAHPGRGPCKHPRLRIRSAVGRPYRGWCRRTG
jgi:spermidine/putrescine-binding protein